MNTKAYPAIRSLHVGENSTLEFNSMEEVVSSGGKFGFTIGETIMVKGTEGISYMTLKSTNEDGSGIEHPGLGWWLKSEVQGYSLKHFGRVENTIEDLKKNGRKYKKGDIVELLGYYEAGDGANHKRKIESVDDGSGVQLSDGLWANIVHSGEVNVSWFGTPKLDQSEFNFDIYDLNVLKQICDTYKGRAMIINLEPKKYKFTQQAVFTSLFIFKGNGASILCDNENLDFSLRLETTYAHYQEYGHNAKIENLIFIGSYTRGTKVGKCIVIRGEERQFGARYSFNKVEIQGFEVGLELGNHAYLNSFDVCSISVCGTAINFPNTYTRDRGENFNFRGCAFGGNTLTLNVESASSGFNFSGCSFDYSDNLANISAGNTSLDFSNCWFEGTGQLLSNSYSTYNFTNCKILPRRTFEKSYDCFVKGKGYVSFNGCFIDNFEIETLVDGNPDLFVTTRGISTYSNPRRAMILSKTNKSDSPLFMMEDFTKCVEFATHGDCTYEILDNDFTENRIHLKKVRINKGSGVSGFKIIFKNYKRVGEFFQVSFNMKTSQNGYSTNKYINLLLQNNSTNRLNSSVVITPNDSVNSRYSLYRRGEGGGNHRGVTDGEFVVDIGITDFMNNGWVDISDFVISDF